MHFNLHETELYFQGFLLRSSSMLSYSCHFRQCEIVPSSIPSQANKMNERLFSKELLLPTLNNLSFKGEIALSCISRQAYTFITTKIIWNKPSDHQFFPMPRKDYSKPDHMERGYTKFCIHIHLYKKRAAWHFLYFLSALTQFFIATLSCQKHLHLFLPRLNGTVSYLELTEAFCSEKPRLFLALQVLLHLSVGLTGRMSKINVIIGRLSFTSDF